MTPPPSRSTLSLGLGVLFLAALVLAAPTLGPGVGVSDSVTFNTIWVKEFIAALHRGEFPPRWLPGAFNGLGASSFVFYPPLAFYVTAAADLIAGHRLEPRQLTAWACLALSFASGCGMVFWLRERTGERWATAGALLFMLAPYHVTDQYVRGAFAELAAYAVLPWLMLAVDRAASDRRRIPALGLGYAALITAHLPATLLVSAIVLPAYVGWRAWTAAPAERLALIGRCLAGGALGVAMAASYLGPAMLMQRAARMEWLWGGDTQNWTLFTADKWPPGPFMPAIAAFSWAAGAAGLAAVLAVLGRKGAATRGPALLWGGVALLALALHAIPWVWQISPLSKVQFAYRIVMVSEFAAVTAVSLAAASGRPGRLALILIVPAITAAWGLHLLAPVFAAVTRQPIDPVTQGLIAAGRAPNEHLPADYFPYPQLHEVKLVSGHAERPLVQIEGAAGQVLSATAFPDGSVAMDVALAGPARLVVRRFTFPSWRAERLDPGHKQPLAVEPHQTSSFVAFQGQSGRHIYRVRQVRTLLEAICDAISLAALALGLALVVVGRRRATA